MFLAHDVGCVLDEICILSSLCVLDGIYVLDEGSALGLV
jgi:hypothetical protein